MLKSSLQRYLSASLVILLSLTFLFFATTGTASAHAKVISATPAIGSTIATAPTTVTVEAAENMNPDPKLSNLFVYGPSGDLISQGNAKIPLNNPKEMSVQIKPESTGGVYIVRWITVSADDNDPDEGAFVFTVKSSAVAATPTTTGTTTTPPPPPPTATNNGFPVAPVSIAAIIALLLGLAAGFGFGRAQARPSTNVGSNATNAAVSEEAPDKVK